MSYLDIATFFMLAFSFYLKRDVFLFGKGKLEYLLITFIALLFAAFLLTGFLAEFIGVFFFLFAFFFLIGSLRK